MTVNGLKNCFVIFFTFVLNLITPTIQSFLPLLLLSIFLCLHLSAGGINRTPNKVLINLWRHNQRKHICIAKRSHGMRGKERKGGRQEAGGKRREKMQMRREKSQRGDGGQTSSRRRRRKMLSRFTSLFLGSSDVVYHHEGFFKCYKLFSFCSVITVESNRRKPPFHP